jgi:hypothetical protein
MAVQAIVDPAEHGHLPGDVAALFLVAIVLGVLDMGNVGSLSDWDGQ